VKSEEGRCFIDLYCATPCPPASLVLLDPPKSIFTPYFSYKNIHELALYSHLSLQNDPG